MPRLIFPQGDQFRDTNCTSTEVLPSLANVVLTHLQGAAFLWAVLQTRQSYFTPYTLPAYITDFLLQCCAILFATTVYAGSPQTLAGLLLLPAIAAYLQPQSRSSPASTKTAPKPPPSEPDHDSTEAQKDPLPVKPFITGYRGAMMVITCTSILAVDFKVFPRRFAKTESFGTSLMDIGVGSFVFASGIVSARQQLREQWSEKSRGMLARVKSAMRHSIPLLLLGLVRLASIKGLDYAEHVSEYGVHWNFFFSLALLPPVVALMQPMLRWIPSYGILAFVIAIAYELLLFMTTLKHYIILSARYEGDWLSQNREGVFSFIGYLAIFIAGMGAGQGILPRDEPYDPFGPAKLPAKDGLDEDADWLASVLDPGSAAQQNGNAEDDSAKQPNPASSIEEPQLKPELPKTALVHLIKWTGLWFVFSVWALWRYGPHLFVSRRMANLGYVCWVCAFNFAQLLLYCGVETLLFPDIYAAKDDKEERRRADEATSKVLKAFNRNGLALFLLANLLTGAINLTLPTWHLGDVEAMVALVSYIGVIAAVGVVLDRYDISIKL